MARIKASVIIVNWDGREHLEECLDGLTAQTFQQFEVIMVDNGSKDRSVPFVREHYPWVNIIELPQNTGFARGNNVGLEHSSGDYLITLNNDTRVEPSWLENLITVADAHPEVGMVGSRICNYEFPNIIDSLGVKVCRDGMSRGAFRGRDFTDLDLSSELEIFFPSACAALYKRIMIEQTGFFDEDFFAYCEDTDLGLRGRLAGWSALLATEAVVRHKYSLTGGSFSPFKLYLVERNHFLTALKNLPVSSIWALPINTACRYAEQFRSVIKAKGSGRDFVRSNERGKCIIALIRAIWDTLLSVRKTLCKRRTVCSFRKLTNKEFSGLLKKYQLSFKELLDNAS